MKELLIISYVEVCSPQFLAWSMKCSDLKQRFQLELLTAALHFMVHLPKDFGLFWFGIN